MLRTFGSLILALFVVACGRIPLNESPGADGSASAAGTPGAAAASGAGRTGTAGTTGTAGATGMAGDTNLTSGCRVDPNQPFGTYVEYHLSIAGPDLDATTQPKVRDRTYYVRLPINYDPTVHYRVVYLGPYCGALSPDAALRLYTASMNDAILVAMMPLATEFGGCFDQTLNSVEYPFFDALHKKIEASFCIDVDREFYAGFSTGASLGYMLDCTFSDVLRATASFRATLPPLPTCKTHPISVFASADTFASDEYQANVMAAARVFTQNGCTGTFMSPPTLGSTIPPSGCGTACSTYDTGVMTPGPAAACVKYSVCPADNPVVFCSMSEGIKAVPEYWLDPAVWNFFKSF